MRSFQVLQVPSTTGNIRGPDTIYVIDLLEDAVVIERMLLPGKSLKDVQEIGKNWEKKQYDK